MPVLRRESVAMSLNLISSDIHHKTRSVDLRLELFFNFVVFAMFKD